MSTKKTTQSIETDEQQQLPPETISFSYCGGNKFSTELATIAHENFADFSEKLSKPTIGAKDGPYIVRGPAATRSDEALDHGELVILDGDSSIDLTTGEVVSPDSKNYSGCPDPVVIHAELIRLNLTHCIVTTHSHTNSVNKCRIFIPFRTASKEELTNTVTYLIHKLHQADTPLADVKENHNWSQPWYMPRVASEQAPFEHYFHQGELINKADVNAWITAKKTKIESSKTTVSEKTNSKATTSYQPNDLDKACSKITASQFTELLEKHDYLPKGSSTLNGKDSYQFMASGSTSGSAGVNLFYCPESNCWVVKTHHGEHDLLNHMPNSFGNYAEALNALEHDGLLELDEKLALINDLVGNQIPRSLIQQLKIDVVTDEGAAFEPGVIDALAGLKKDNPADYIRDINLLKAANKKLSITDLKQQVNAISKPIKPSIQETVVSMIKESATLFYDDKGTGFAEVSVDTHTEYHSITSTQFKTFVDNLYYDTTGTVLKKPDLSDAIYTLNGMALYSKDMRPVYLRCAEHNGEYYIDLCNPSWQVIKVTEFNWEVLDLSPVPFIRNNNMLSLPFPTKENSDLSRIIRNTNLSGDNLTLTLAFIMEALRIDTPFAIAEIIGCQGSAKSFTQNVIRKLIDPNIVNLRGAPTTVEDVYIGAKNNFLLSLNNLSRISAAIQDACCNLATGGGAAKRKLYSDDEENVYDVKSPIIMNGIVGISTSSDLIDRTVKIYLPSIKKKNRKTEQTLKSQLENDLVFIYAGILDLFTETLAELPNVHLAEPERMADFTVLGAAMVKTNTYRSLGLGQDFVAIYTNNCTQSTQNSLDSSPVALALQDYLNVHGKFTGTVKELLNKLTLIKQISDAWPKSPRGLTDALMRLEVPLSAVGITIDRQGHTVNGSKLTIIFDKNFIQKNKNSLKSPSPLSPLNIHNEGSDGDFGNVFSGYKNDTSNIEFQGEGNELNIMKLAPDAIKNPSKSQQLNPFDKKPIILHGETEYKVGTSINRSNPLDLK